MTVEENLSQLIAVSIGVLQKIVSEMMITDDDMRLLALCKSLADVDKSVADMAAARDSWRMHFAKHEGGG